MLAPSPEHSRDLSPAQYSPVAAPRAPCDSAVVSLNVGGSTFSARLGTLIASHPGSLLSEILWAWPSVSAVDVDAQGRVFLDRDPVVFRLVLNFLRTGALALPDDFSEWRLLKREIVEYKIPRLTQLVSTLDAQVEFCLGGEHFRLPRKTLLRFKFFERLLQGETSMTLNEEGMMTICNRDANLFVKVLTVLQTCDGIASGEGPPSAAPKSLTPERLARVCESIFGVGLAGDELSFACERGMAETRFYTE